MYGFLYEVHLFELMLKRSTIVVVFFVVLFIMY